MPPCPPITYAQLGVFRPALVCSMCRETFTDPAVLPCGHTFCWGCAFPYVDKFVNRKCPTCEAPSDTRDIRRCPLVADVLAGYQKLLERAKHAPAPAPPALASPVELPRRDTDGFMIPPRSMGPPMGLGRRVPVKSLPPPPPAPVLAAPLPDGGEPLRPTGTLGGDSSCDSFADADGIAADAEVAVAAAAVADFPPTDSPPLAVPEAESDEVVWGRIKASLGSTWDVAYRELLAQAASPQQQAALEGVKDVDARLAAYAGEMAEQGITLAVEATPMLQPQPPRKRSAPDGDGAADGGGAKRAKVVPSAPTPPSEAAGAPRSEAVPASVVKDSGPTPSASAPSEAAHEEAPVPPPRPARPVLVASSSLGKEEKAAVDAACAAHGHRLVDKPGSVLDKGVTHLITADPAPRTIKYCCALVLGVWVVTKGWLDAAGAEELGYLVGGDRGKGCAKVQGPLLARLALGARTAGRATFEHNGREYAASLLKGWGVTLHGEFKGMGMSRGELAELCVLAGAVEVTREGPDPRRHLVLCEGKEDMPSARAAVAAGADVGRAMHVRSLLTCICKWDMNGV